MAETDYSNVSIASQQVPSDHREQLSALKSKRDFFAPSRPVLPLHILCLTSLRQSSRRSVPLSSKVQQNRTTFVEL